MWNICAQLLFFLTHPDFLNYMIPFPVDLPKCSLKVPGKGMIVLQSLHPCFISLGCFLSISKVVKAERWQYFKQKAIILNALPNNWSQSMFTLLELVFFPYRPWSPSVFTETFILVSIWSVSQLHLIFASHNTCGLFLVFIPGVAGLGCAKPLFNFKGNVFA